mmetsp:Transcript_22713/g.49743  ORF Transcript_22713/g.49743 Transcript_22713/m.49743 type:complete len:87 (-) Transcript_22713:262-522(-)
MRDAMVFVTDGNRATATVRRQEEYRVKLQRMRDAMVFATGELQGAGPAELAQISDALGRANALLANYEEAISQRKQQQNQQRRGKH